MPQWLFGFNKIWEISWLGDYLLGSQEELCSMELAAFTSISVLNVEKTPGGH